MTTITPGSLGAPLTPRVGKTRGGGVEMDPRIKARRDAVNEEHARERARSWLFALGFVLVILLAAAILRSPLFDVEVISVEGASNPEAIVEISGIEYGTALINADVDAARAAIAELPFVESVTSARSWSGQVTFAIIERTPAAQFVHSDGQVQVTDLSGRVLSVQSTPLAGPVQVTGVDLAAQPGQWLDQQGLEIIRAAASVPTDLLTATSHLKAHDGGLALELRTGATVLIGSDRELTAKYDALRAFLAGVDLRCMAELDLRAPSVPVLNRDPACV